MQNNQIMIDLFNQMQDMELKEAYLIYIKFCYKIIPLLNNISSYYVKDSIKKAQSFWFDSNSNVTELDLINRRVKIISDMEEENIQYGVHDSPELKFCILPLWTNPPSNDIGDSLDWALALLEEINISENVITSKLSEALKNIS